MRGGLRIALFPLTRDTKNSLSIYPRLEQHSGGHNCLTSTPERLGLVCLADQLESPSDLCSPPRLTRTRSTVLGLCV
jgi:hypothetical protein